jgi:hypothetical protein
MQLTFEPGKPFRRIRLNEPERAATLTNRPIALGGGISGVYCLKQTNDALMFTRGSTASFAHLQKGAKSLRRILAIFLRTS